MAKQISPFINMCQEDQIALLKGGCTELMILRSIISYNPEKNSWSVSIIEDKREYKISYISTKTIAVLILSLIDKYFHSSYQVIDRIGNLEWMC